MFIPKNLRTLKSLAFLILFISISTFTYAQNARLIGEVKAENGELLAGATVEIQELNIGRITDANGRFEFSSIASGTYTLLVRFVGFETLETTVEVNGTTRTQLTLVEEALVVEGLVVTAQRRSQSIQDVPLTVTNYQGEFIQNNGIQEFDVLSAYVPGLQVQIQSVNNPGFVVRGITSDSGDSRIEPRVSVFQDGVSISKSRGSVVELYDMERVEVLKGPQGTLFGRGAQIGAVHLIQNKPKPYLDAELALGYGNFNESFARGFVNSPIVEGKLMGRFAFIYNRRDGFIENLSGGNLNGKETFAIRPSLRWIPDENTIIDAIFNYQYDNPDGTSFKSGSIAAAGDNTNPNDPARFDEGRDFFVERTVWGGTLIADRTLSQSLSLKSITAYRRFDSLEPFDADGTVAPVLYFEEDAEGRQFSEELRLSYNSGGKFSGFIGASYFYEIGSQGVPFETNENSYYALISPSLGAFGLPALPLLNPDGSPNLSAGALLGIPFKSLHQETFTNYGELSAYEIFFDGTYQVTPKLSLTGGLRATYEDVTGGFQTSQVDPVNDPASASVLGTALLGRTDGSLLVNTTNGERFEASDSFQSWVGRFAVDYEIASGSNVFATISRGRRPNVINVASAPTATPGVNEAAVTILDEEIVINYELGFKQLALNNRLRFDVSGFYYDYSNFRTNIAFFDSNNNLVFQPRNSGSATALGLETSVDYTATKELSIFANYGYVDATFDDEDDDGNPQQLAGNRFRLTPEHSFSAGINFDYVVSKGINFFARPTYNYRTEVFFEETNLPGIQEDAYGLLNLRTGFGFNDGRYEVAFYAENLLDEEYIIDAGNTGGSFGIPTFIAGPPRFVGVQVTGRL